MGIFRGLGVVNDGLVFGYDTGYPISDNAVNNRFNQGEPTVNHVTDSIVQISGFGGSYSLLDSATKSFQLNINSFNSSGQTWRSFMWDMRSHAGSAVTISATIEVPSDSPGDFAWVMMGQANSLSNGTQAATYLGYSAASERYQKTTTNTERITWSGTIGNTGTANQPNGIIGFTVWYNGGTNGTNCFIKVSNVQIEKIAHETPFVNGTRSDTASLIDLKRTTSIDIGDVSFDSNAQPTFDGTDDEINLPNDLGYSADSVSVFAWFKINGTPTNNYHIICGTSQLEMSIYHPNATYLRNGVNGSAGRFVSNNGNQALNDGNYHYYGFTFDGSTKTAYIDGVAVGTQSVSGTITTSFSGRRIGNYGDGYYANGDIPVYKVYDKVLTPEEVTQNYNAYKNRFNT